MRGFFREYGFLLERFVLTIALLFFGLTVFSKYLLAAQPRLTPQSWTAQRNLKRSLYISSITAADNKNLWLVANTTDYQASLKPQDRTLDRFVMPPTLGIVAASNNGGRSWTTRLVQSGTGLYSLCFIDKNIGWVTGASDEIIATSDGGSTWNTQKTPVSSFWQEPKFLDKRYGWVLGSDGKVLRTTDGGNIWKLSEIKTTSSLMALNAADETHIWIVGEQGSVYESSDSGTTWQSAATKLSDAFDHWSESTVNFRSIKFINSKVGFIGADVLTKYGDFEPKALVFKTVDGGLTWKSSIIPKALGLLSAEFVNESTTWIIPGGRQRFLLETSNGGHIWSAISLRPVAEPGFLIALDSRSAWFLNKSDTFDSDLIFRTLDGGKYWDQFHVRQQLFESMNALPR